MASWIYVFSRFTSEALLFESLFICMLCASYAAFWVLRKRKHGVLGMTTETGVVKNYLGQLILDAEQMRTQLFGLLAGTEAVSGEATWRSISPMQGMPAGASAGAAGSDPELAQKMVALEAKMIEQARATETILADKARLEKELAAAKAAGGGKGATTGGDSSKLQEKINALENKLAEYSVIEDDLANLKRLQQENTQLKAQLSSKGGAPAAGDTTVAAAAPELAAPTDTEVAAAAAAEAAQAEVAQAAEIEANAAAAAVPAAAAEAPAAEALAPAGATTTDPAFEGLVDHVEQSLVEPAAAAAADAFEAAPELTTPASSSASTISSGEKSDADLVAEFEKMLNS